MVNNYDSSGWYNTYLNNVDSKKHKTLVKVFKSQIIQEPSAEADTAYSLFFLT